MRNVRPFRFGVGIVVAGSRREWMEKARKAEALGYSTFLMGDGFGVLAPVPALMSAADATSSIRLGYLVLDNSLRHPVMLAREAATIDLLSAGRLELGLGAGWQRLAYEKAGISFEPAGVRVSRLAEALHVIKGLWGGRPLDFRGDYYSVDDLDGYPKPLQLPRPPILVGGGGDRLLAIGAREADIIDIGPRPRRDATGPDETDLNPDSLARKVSLIQKEAGDRFPDIELSIVLQALGITDDRRGTAEGMAAEWGNGITARQVLENPYALVGSADQVADELRARRERYGVSYFVVTESNMEAFAPVMARLVGE